MNGVGLQNQGQLHAYKISKIEKRLLKNSIYLSLKNTRLNMMSDSYGINITPFQAYAST